jgi:hypothetical protein
MTNGSRLEMVGSPRLVSRLPRCSGMFWSILGNEVNDAREGSRGRCLVGPPLLHRYVSVMADMDGLLCTLL